jgi:hypothetical protein
MKARRLFNGLAILAPISPDGSVLSSRSGRGRGPSRPIDPEQRDRCGQSPANRVGAASLLLQARSGSRGAGELEVTESQW